MRLHLANRSPACQGPTGTEWPLHVEVARALYGKGFRLGMLDRNEEAIVVYDDLLARFGSATESPLRDQVAYAKSARDRLRNS